jgi:quercetin dioxygenase-like cupin family protein
MPLPQDISPVNSELMDSIVRTSQMDWIPYQDETGFMKVLSYRPESGQWSVLFKWLKGHVAPPHKHLTSAYAFIISGKLKVRDEIFDAGDYIYEPNGMVHDATEALEDTVYLFHSEGPVLYFDDNSFTAYTGWEEIKKLSEQN